MNSFIDNLTNIVTTSVSNGNLDSLPEDCFGSTSTNKNAACLVLKNKNKIVEESVSQLVKDYPHYNYPDGARGRQRCIRDTGLFVDALVADIFIGGNFYTKGYIKQFFTVNGKSWLDHTFQHVQGQANSAFNKASELIKNLITDSENFIVDFDDENNLSNLICSKSVEFLAKKRKQNFQFSDRIPDKNLVDEILSITYNLVPSKQLMFPYKVNVYGPECESEKKFIFNHSTYRTDDAVPEHCVNYQLRDAPYIILFTSRSNSIEDLPSECRASLYPQAHSAISNRKFDNRNWLIEVGLFEMLFIMVSLSKGVDVSFCNNIRVDRIKDKFFPNEDVEIAGSMMFGYAVPEDQIEDSWIQYKHNNFKKENYPTRPYKRPLYERVVEYKKTSIEY
jgi:hypothetical protein